MHNLTVTSVVQAPYGRSVEIRIVDAVTGKHLDLSAAQIDVRALDERTGDQWPHPLLAEVAAEDAACARCFVPQSILSDSIHLRWYVTIETWAVL